MQPERCRDVTHGVCIGASRNSPSGLSLYLRRTVSVRVTEANMRNLMVIAGAALLVSLAACAYYDHDHS